MKFGDICINTTQPHLDNKRIGRVIQEVDGIIQLVNPRYGDVWYALSQSLRKVGELDIGIFYDKWVTELAQEQL